MSDFLRIGVAAQGYAPLSKNCFVLFLDMLGHASSNSARADAIDGDSELAQLDSQSFGEMHQ